MSHFKLDNNGNYQQISIGSQNFSGGDYSKTNADDLGIVFPYNPKQEIKNGFVVSSLIDHHNDDFHLLKHTEARNCNKINDDLVYEELLTASIVIHENELGHQSSAMNSFFYGNNEFLEIAYIEARQPILMQENKVIMEIYKNFPTLTAIDNKNIKEREYKYKSYTFDKNGWITTDNKEWIEPNLFDVYSPTDDEKIEKILDKWFKKTNTAIDEGDIMWAVNEISFNKTITISALELAILSEKANDEIIASKYNIKEIIDLMNKDFISYVREKYKYTEKEIKKDSDKIIRIMEANYQGIFD